MANDRGKRDSEQSTMASHHVFSSLRVK
ncbi:hypothetical protein CCACVL1_09365 [Corchorus capsularis]|uniref:Uncharacterized protein n=1 Tax=Corchorus capsularis TaxID=210143 RepID=A0A1R3IWM1_COCAP|nr:hypothetical protein CCACVL1_09365 [Corchorus capsularis]